MKFCKDYDVGRSRLWWEAGVPNGNISLLTPHLDRLVLPFSGVIKAA